MKAGLVGFEPTTTGLKVRCATWLRYRPPCVFDCVYNLVFYKIGKQCGNFKTSILLLICIALVV